MSGESSAYSALETAIANNSEDNIIKNLKVLLSDSQNIEFKNISIVKSLLNSTNIEILKFTSQGIAESAKSTEHRQNLTDPDIIKILLSSLDKSDVPCMTQVCRALGNLCYENDTARQFVTDSDGLKQLISVIELNLNSNNSQLINITCGFLLNYLMSNESAQKSALDLDILKLIEKIISQKISNFTTSEDLFTHLLLILNLLSDVLVDAWFSSELCLHLVKILELSVNPEISEISLELLHNQGENDDIKLLLAKAGLCELLFNLLEEHKSLVQDEEGRALMKLACDLIVLILTGDESMTLLYDNGNGKVYKNMNSWLESEDIDLLITGVLAMGNFARNDAHCIKMVQNGLSETLLGILSKHNNTDGEIRLQHALLSALRNLVIPLENKARILKTGLVDVIYPLLATEQQPVVFKLLGTLRMVIDGQESTALQLSLKVDLLEKLVEWCFNSDHPGVRAESPRLLAWLIKHCHSTKPFPNMIKTKDCIRCLVEMVPSSHAVMQNEALLALNLLCVTCLNNDTSNLTDNQKLCNASLKTNPNNQNDISNTVDEAKHEVNENINVEYSFEQILINADLGTHVAFLLNKYGDKMEKEVVANLLTLLEYLIKLPSINQHLKNSEVSGALKKCLKRDNLKSLHDRVHSITSSIDSG